MHKFCTGKDDFMTDKEQKAAAKSFINEWKGKGYEKGESQSF